WGCQIRLQDALGTTALSFVDAELNRILQIFRNKQDGKIDAVSVNAVLAILDGARQENEIEGMLVLQMAVTHALAMKVAGNLSRVEATPQQDSAALALSRLHRSFTAQIDALASLRRGGRQKVVVEHVHVYPGGQAIVGSVTHTGGKGGANENSNQPHATDDRGAT